MLNEQQRTADPERPAADVVVTARAPAGGTTREAPVPESTRVDVYPASAGPNPAAAIERETDPRRTRRDVVAGRRLTIRKVIDACWFLVGLLEVGLLMRFFFELTAAGPAAGFVQFVDGITQPFMAPFYGIFGVPRAGNNVFDPNIIVAMVVYTVIGWGITRLLAMTIESPSEA